MSDATRGGTLAPAAVEPLLRGRFGRPYLWRETCSSTQLLLDGSLSEGAVAVTEEQTAGRGRLGRVWEAPPGRAILFSMVLRPPAGRPAPQISIAAGIAVARALEAAVPELAPGAAVASGGSAASPLSPRIKWPNDVLLDGRKVCGILAEARDGVVVLGIGLNVNQQAGDFPPTPNYPPTSLRVATGREQARAPLLAELLWQLEQAYVAWCAGGLAALHGELVQRDFLAGRTVLVDGAEATALGIDVSGALAIELGGVRRLVESGEVSVAPAT
jgi:BirA family biotin operon repressor/biotin-[acetyl-CoA-carboxylase] ligase